MKSRDPRHALEELLHVMGQEHLLNQLSSEEEYPQLLRQVKKIDLELLVRQQKALTAARERLHYEAPPHLFPPKETLSLQLAEKFGCVVLAGGQASRLRLKGPKGFFEITLIKKKTLFQLLAEKIAAASRQIGRDIPVAFMTSIAHRTEVEIFFIRNNFFGLKPSQVSFFSQTSWPLLDLEGNLFLESRGKLAQGPNGNGDFYKRFFESGIYEKWEQRGVEHVRMMPIDNPLALPVDLSLFSAHLAHKNEVTVQAIAKEAGERVGMLSLSQRKLSVLEYGEYDHPGRGGAANTGLYLFSMSFIRKAKEMTLPLHKACKAAVFWGGEVPKEPNAWKFETFLFDAFPQAEKSEVFIYPREEIFAPLKNLEGEDSIVPVQEAILAYERNLFSKRTGCEPPEDARFELGSSFYYPTKEQEESFLGKKFPRQSYIETL